MNAPERAALVEDAVAARVAATIRADVRAMGAYAVAKADGLVKLDAMESPYRLPATLRDAMAAAVAAVPVNRYPDGSSDAVKAALRRTLDLPAGAGLMLGNGSDELIQIITTAIAAPGACIVAPDPTFVMYRVNATLAHARYVGVPLSEDFSLDEPALQAAIARERPALVWLAYPNNPTGNRFDRAAVERIAASAPGLVVVDEAYYAYAGDSFLPRVLEHPNLVVVRTVSKIGMAGVRLGYAAAHPAWIAELDKVRPPYNINVLTQVVVPVLLRHGALLGEQAAAIRRERARMAAALAALRRVTVFPSHANFLLVRVPDAGRWFGTLREAGILVKNVDGWHPLLANCLRITIGTPAENNAVLDALSRYA